MTADAFAHLPHLRGRITPAEQSDLRATPELLATWDAHARALGRPANWRLSEDEIQASRRAVLGACDGARDVWVFAYGSLMWNPGVHFAEVRQAALAGYQRRFTFRTSLGRGTPEQPALMLALEPREGCCHGLAYRIAADMADAETTILWRREMLRGSYRPLLLPASTPQGAVDALVLTSNPEHPDHVGELPLAETATAIAQAAGILGTNRDYLEQLATQLQALAVDDPYIERLLGQVRGLCAG